MPVDLKIRAMPAESDRSRRIAEQNQADDRTPMAGEAPGAVFSPQMPGQVPDRSTVPGQYVTRITQTGRGTVPLTQLGTAEGIMRFFQAQPGQEENPKRFEMGPASYEEVRKAYPALLPPRTPAPGYALETGHDKASEMQQFGGPLPTGPVVLASNQAEIEKVVPKTESVTGAEPNEAQQ